MKFSGLIENKLNLLYAKGLSFNSIGKRKQIEPYRCKEYFSKHKLLTSDLTDVL